MYVIVDFTAGPRKKLKPTAYNSRQSTCSLWGCRLLQVAQKCSLEWTGHQYCKSRGEEKNDIPERWKWNKSKAVGFHLLVNDQSKIAGCPLCTFLSCLQLFLPVNYVLSTNDIGFENGFHETPVQFKSWGIFVLFPIHPEAHGRVSCSAVQLHRFLLSSCLCQIECEWTSVERSQKSDMTLWCMASMHQR